MLKAAATTKAEKNTMITKGVQSCRKIGSLDPGSHNFLPHTQIASFVAILHKIGNKRENPEPIEICSFCISEGVLVHPHHPHIYHIVL